MASQFLSQIGQHQLRSCGIGKTYCVCCTVGVIGCDTGLKLNFSGTLSSAAISEGKGSGTCCYCSQQNSQVIQ